MFGGFGLLFGVFGVVKRPRDSTTHCVPFCTLFGLISTMSLTGQPSSSRRAEKAPVERLNPLQEKEMEIAELQRHNYGLRQENNELRSEKGDLEAEKASWGTLPEELKAKHEIIEALSNDLEKRESEIDHYKGQLQGLHEDLLDVLLRKRHEVMREMAAFSGGDQLEIADARNVMDEESGPLPLAASKKAETKERANPQLEQSGSHNHAEELESQKTPKDEWFQLVKDKKSKLALGSGSKATFGMGLFSNTNYFQALDEDKVGKKKEPKKAEILNQNPADKRYVVPSPDKVKSDEQSRAGLTTSTPRLISSLAPVTKTSTITVTDGWSSGARHGSKTLPPKKHTPVVPRSKYVRPLVTAQKAETTRDYAQVAAESTLPVIVMEGVTDSPNLSKERRRWLEFVGLIPQKNSAKEVTEREQNQLTPGVHGSSNSKSGQVKVTTDGDKLLQSIDKYVVNEGDPQLAEESEDDSVKPKQSSSDILAKEVISEKLLTASIDATDNGSEMVKTKNELAGRIGSEEVLPGQLPINADCYQYLHTDELEKEGKGLKKAEIFNTDSIGERYVIPPTGTTDLLGPSYHQRCPLSTTSRWKRKTTIMPQSSTPRSPILPTNPQRLQRSESVGSSADLQKIEPVRTTAQVATETPRELVSSSDEEEKQKPDASVQTGFAAATSQTRGKYWPRGVL